MANAMLDADRMFVTVRTLDAARAAALASARAEFERTLIVLREENSTLRRMLEAAATRADTLLTELARSLVVQATPAPTPGPRPRLPVSADPIRGLGNVFDHLKPGDPDGEFASLAAASLMAAEDDDGAAATA